MHTLIISGFSKTDKWKKNGGNGEKNEVTR